MTRTTVEEGKILLDPLTATDLERIRKSTNLTQAELAQLLNVTRTTVNRWERGARRPSDEQFRQIVDTLVPLIAGPIIGVEDRIEKLTKLNARLGKEDPTRQQGFEEVIGMLENRSFLVAFAVVGWLDMQMPLGHWRELAMSTESVLHEVPPSSHVRREPLLRAGDVSIAFEAAMRGYNLKDLVAELGGYRSEMYEERAASFWGHYLAYVIDELRLTATELPETADEWRTHPGYGVREE